MFQFSLRPIVHDDQCTLLISRSVYHHHHHHHKHQGLDPLIRSVSRVATVHSDVFPVIELLHQPLHIYKIYKILHIKNIKSAPTCFGPKSILTEL